MDIEERIIRTVAYFDLSDYPLTRAEISRWLIPEEPRTKNRFPSLDETDRGLTDLISKGVLKEERGLLSAADREGLPAMREERFRFSARKWKRARRWAAAFAAVPGVELVGIGNTLAYNNAKDGSDIDFFIVAAPGTIWRTRIFCAGLAALFNLRPRSGDNRDKLCLSFFVTSEMLDLSVIARIPDASVGAMKQSPGNRVASSESREARDGGNIEDVYLHYWLRQLVPLAGRAETAAAFRAANGGWAERGFAGKAGMWRWLFRPVGWLPGNFLKGAQGKRFPRILREAEKRNDGSVVISDKMLKFHVVDRRAEVRERWERRVEFLMSNF